MDLFEVLQVVNRKDGPDVKIVYFDEFSKDTIDARVGDYNILNAIEDVDFEVSTLDVEDNKLIVTVDRTSLSGDE